MINYYNSRLGTLGRLGGCSVEYQLMENLKLEMEFALLKRNAHFTLLQASLSNIPMHHMSTFWFPNKVPSIIKKCIGDIYGDSYKSKGGYPLVGWERWNFQSLLEDSVLVIFIVRIMLSLYPIIIESCPPCKMAIKIHFWKASTMEEELWLSNLGSTSMIGSFL